MKMNFPIFVVFLCCTSVALCADANQNDVNFMGTAELLPSDGVRRSRISRDFVPNRMEKKATLSEDTVREYGHLLQMDTTNFSEQQKALLEKIVERVARLSGALDDSTDDTPSSLDNESQGRGNKSRGKKNSHKVAAQKQIVASDLEATTNTAETKTLIKNEHAKQTTATTIIASDSGKTTVKNSNKTTPIVAQKTTNTGNHHKIKPNNSNGSMKANMTEVYFGNITTSSIVDSLSADNAREDIYVNRRPGSTAATAIVDKNKIKVSLCEIIFFFIAN